MTPTRFSLDLDEAEELYRLIEGLREWSRWGDDVVDVVKFVVDAPPVDPPVTRVAVMAIFERWATLVRDGLESARATDQAHSGGDTG